LTYVDQQALGTSLSQRDAAAKKGLIESYVCRKPHPAMISVLTGEISYYRAGIPCSASFTL
jgi:hypothetical protein